MCNKSFSSFSERCSRLGGGISPIFGVCWRTFDARCVALAYLAKRRNPYNKKSSSRLRQRNQVNGAPPVLATLKVRAICCAFSRRLLSIAPLHTFCCVTAHCSHEASLLFATTTDSHTSNMLALRHLARRTAARGFATTSTNSRTWKVYLSGEIHSDWREVIGDGVAQRNLPVTIDAPNTSHEDSDDWSRAA